MVIRLLHAVWPLVAAAAFALSIIAIPAAYAQLRVPCVVECTNSRASPQIASAIVGAGSSLDRRTMSPAHSSLWLRERAP